MKPKLILHAGTHKTGTTAIQAFAARHRDALAARGVLYPDLAPLGRVHRYPQHVFAHALADKDAALTADGAARLAGLWAEAAARDGRTVLISAEPLYRHRLRAAAGGQDAGWRASRGRYLDRLAAALAPFEVEVVLVFRRPDDYARSLFQENARLTSRRAWDSFPAFRAHAEGGSLRYAQNAELFAERFGRVRGLIYEDLPRGDGFCPAFFAALGLDVGGLAPVGVVRESLDPAETLVKLALDRRFGGAKRNVALRKFVKSPAVAALLAERLGPGPFGFWESAEARAAFLATHAAEMEQLRTQFFPDRATLFPPPGDDLPPSVPPLDAALQALLARRAEAAGLEVRPPAPGRKRKAAPAAPPPPAAAGAVPAREAEAEAAVRYRFPHKKDASWNSFDRQRARYEVIRDFLGTGAVGAEIGVYKGGFGEFLLGHCRKLYLVDTWYRAGGFWNSKLENDSRVASVINILSVYKQEIEKGEVEVVIETSENFLRTVPDAYFDFLYLDTSHKYEITLREIQSALPKLKQGGRLFGDDYDPDPASKQHGVFRAVNEFVAASGARMVVNTSRQWGLVRP